MRARKDLQIRHLAFQVIAQLPEEVREALRILDYARKVLILVEAPSVAPQAPIPLKVVSRKD